MFSAILKEATKPAHQSLEKIIIQQIRSIRTPADYKKLLQFFYSYYQPLEQLLEPFFRESNVIPQFAERRKAAAILHDIQEIPTVSSMIDECPDLPVIRSLADALGVQYVLEGSTLGGAFIAKMLYQQAAIPENQLQFFIGYAEKSSAMWQAFTDALNVYVDKNGNEDSIIKAATECFQKFERWAKNIYAVAPLPSPVG